MEKAKALELIQHYSKITGYSLESQNGWMLKEMALYNVEEQIKLLEEEMIACDFNYRSIFIDELKEVKKEINNL